MTEDYKEQLLNYVTGTLENTSPTTDEIFKEIIEVSRDDWTYGTILPNGWSDFHFEGLIQEKNSDTLILYGGYRASNSTGIDNEVYGIIILLDNNFKPIKSFFEFDSGTKLRYIQKMQQAEDNSFYMVDDTNFAFKYNDTILTSTKRLVILNNFTTQINNEYKLILRSSYIFPSGYNTFKCENLTKNPSQSQYILIGKTYEQSAGNYQTVSEISINIPYGSSVEWNKTNIITYASTTSENTEGKYLTSFVKFQNDTYQVKTLCGYYHETRSGGQVTSTEQYIRIYTKPFNYSTYSSINILNNPEITGNSEELENQAIFLNENTIYFVLDNINNTYVTTWDLKIQLWEYNISTYAINKIYENSYGTGQPAQQEQIFLSVNQGYLYIENIKKKTSTTADYYLQRYEDVWNPKSVSENKSYQWNQRSLYVSNSYNLLKLFLFPVNPRGTTWYFPVVKEVYNPNQYNGESYVSNNVLSPLYSNLYSNGSLIFSRNLYNVSKQNNMTMSSVEIPNTYLNDLTITQNDLISKANIQMNSNLQNWTKNIYEVVDLNFLNTISVIDEDTNTSYIESAIKVNNAVTDGGDTNYQNTPCNKYRINYSDSTTSIKPLYWSFIDNTHKETTITFYVDKDIASIDFISNDETTIYLNIPVEVEIGKYYSINEKIRIGE
jgi:hypothetical protein